MNTFVEKVRELFSLLRSPSDENATPSMELVCADPIPSAFVASIEIMNANDIEFKDTRSNTEETTQDSSCFLKISQNGYTDVITHPHAILRYVGKMAHVYPQKNILNSAIVDDWIEYNREFMIPLNLNTNPDMYGLANISERERLNHRRWCLLDHIPNYLNYIEKTLAKNEYICTTTISAADYCWLSTLNWLASGNFKGVTLSIYPEITAYMERNTEYVDIDLTDPGMTMDKDHETKSKEQSENETETEEVDLNLSDKMEENINAPPSANDEIDCNDEIKMK